MAVKICLDAGHYGKYNRSPANHVYYESDMAWKLHQMLKKYLEQYGCEVVTTRASQEGDKDLTERGRMAKGCDLFLSVHSNAVGSSVNENVDYPIVYAPLNGKGDKLARLLADCIAQTMGTRQPGRVGHRANSSGTADYYGVIRGAVAMGTPGLILEHSFHTNTRTTKWLLDENNLDKLARAEAKVIARYYNLYTEEEEEEMKKFNTIEEVPNYGKSTVEKLVDSGALKGNENGLDLSEDMLRILVILDRLGKL